MGLNAINGCLTLTSGVMDYIRFGGGERVMVMLPGVGDGLKTVKGMALPFAMMYCSLTKDFTTRIAETFSCTLAFRSSYLENTSRKYPDALRSTNTRKIDRKTTTIK